MNDIGVRQAGLADVDSIGLLFDKYRQFYGRESNIDAARLFLTSRFEHGQSTILIAQNRDSIVGFTQLFPSFSSVSLARTFILNDLYVNEDFRCKGVGRALLDAAKNYAVAVGAIRLTLSTAVDNSTAQALYESTGWQRDKNFFVYHLPVT